MAASAQRLAIGLQEGGVREFANRYDLPFAVPEAGASPQRRRGARGSGGGAADTRPRRKLENVSEQRVLKMGLLRLREVLTSAAAAGDAASPPRRQDGTRFSMPSSASFFKRLLDDGLELKVCHEGDVSGAQSDLKHLSPEQLLAIRVGSIDFATESGSHSAHQNFLTSVDAQLFEKLARRLLEGGSAAAALPTQWWEPLHALGIRVVLVHGAIEALASGWGVEVPGASEEVPPLPGCWVLRLDEEAWGGASVAVFRASQLSVDVLPGPSPDFSTPAAGERVAVVADRSVGVSKDRRLYWEILALDPQTDDIMAELARKEGASQKQLTSELSTLSKQRFANRRDILGLDAPTVSSGGEDPSTPAEEAASVGQRTRRPVPGLVAELSPPRVAPGSTYEAPPPRVAPGVPPPRVAPGGTAGGTRVAGAWTLGPWLPSCFAGLFPASA